MNSKATTAAIDRDGTPHYRMFIGGEWVDTIDTYPVVNPADESVVATVAKATTDHVNSAVAAAKASFDNGEWRTTPPSVRADILDRVATALEAKLTDLALLSSKETGIPVRAAAGLGVGFPVSHIRHFAELTRTHRWTRPVEIGGAVVHAGYIKKAPIGVCAGIVPWNFPAVVGTWKAIPPLAAGNSVVIKTDEKTPVYLLELAHLLSEAGVPDGVFNVVVGDGATIGEHLVAHPDVGLVSFTGSTATGRHVMATAAQTVKHVLLELGGKGPNIITEGADLGVAIDGSLYAFLLHAGQACESGTRLLVPRSMHDEVVSRLTERIGTLTQGDPQDLATDIGPVMSRDQRDRILGYIESGKEEGATLVCGGGVPQGQRFQKGFWVEPTIFTDVDPAMAIFREEIFGPVLTVTAYDSIDEAIKLANDSDYGLSAGIWSEDIPAAMEIADRLDAGSVWINDWHNISQALPFGGFKQSGVGRELGPDALDEFTQDKAVTIDLSGTVENRAYGLVLPPRDA